MKTHGDPLGRFHRPSRAIVPGLLVALCLGFGWAAPAGACTSPPPQPPPVWVEIDGLDVWITIHDYTTFGADPADSCACALNQVPALATVDAFEIVPTDGLGPLGFGGFVPDAEVNASFDKLQPANWAGFLAGVMETVPAGRTVSLVFHGTLAPGEDFATLQADLAGAVPLIGTDEASAGGTIIGGSHLAFAVAGEIRLVDEEPVIDIPTLSGIGLSLVALALVLMAIVMMRRRALRMPSD